MNKIELLRPPKTRGGNWTVVLDDGSEQVVPEGTVAELALYQGQALDDALRETLETESRRRSVRELAGRLLVSWSSPCPSTSGCIPTAPSAV